MEENKSKKDSSPEVELTDIVAEEIGLQPVMEEGLESTESRVEGLPHTVTQPWQNETNSNTTMMHENLDITQQLFEHSQQMQQMFTHMLIVLRAVKSTGDGRVMSTLAAKGTSPITASETTSGRGGNLSVFSVSELGQSHQGECENAAQVRTTCQVMSFWATATQETPPPAGSARTLGRTESLSVESVSDPELSHQGEHENTARVCMRLTNLTTLSANRQASGDNNSTRSSKPSGNQELTVTSRNEEWVKELLSTFKLSQNPLPTFNEGSCADYWVFKRAFQSHVREDGISEHQKLGYLITAYSGPAKQELCGCQELEDPKKGYKEAWDLLEVRHGNKRTYIQHLIKGPPWYNGTMRALGTEGSPSARVRILSMV
ncbi:hypothetical protein E2C01_060288 [Portunus trituberculatus]|uniref:Uncharacterized protein n=1 Tax=Portunus trituberculatus TaxID=210409 RepID=A0A5B7H7M2_PORTR|nr:hypothetical protein [Portunus trituberculatus]